MKELHKNTDLNDLDNEVWIDIIGYDGVYQVSNLGRIKTLSRWIQLRSDSGFYSKEKIKKIQCSEQNSALRISLSLNGHPKVYMVSRLVYFSFNYKVKNLPEYFVMHKDNNWKNNNLNNLKIGTLSEISTLTFNHGKNEHLKLGNPTLSKHKQENATLKNGAVSSLICKRCDKDKPIEFFRHGNNLCKKCDSDKRYFEKYNKKRVKGFEIKETDVKTGKITIYSNFNDKDLLKKVSIVTAIKYAKNGCICKITPQSKKNFNPFRLEILKNE
jgi:hypothetical protein